MNENDFWSTTCDKHDRSQIRSAKKNTDGVLEFNDNGILHEYVAANVSYRQTVVTAYVSNKKLLLFALWGRSKAKSNNYLLEK